MKGKAKNLDMTVGDPLKLLTLFTIPALASNLLNQIYTLTDSLIVGRYLGQTSLAAVGVCMPVILMVASMIIGLNIGVGILMSQSFGRHDFGQMRHTLANSVYLGLVLGVIVALIGIPLARPILRLMGTPEGPLNEAVSYIRISFAATVFPIYYFMFSNAFRGIGDGYTALYCLIVSVVGNILLDIVFVVKLGLGVAGSAYATALAQGMSVVFAIIMLYAKYPDMRMGKTDFKPDMPLISKITRLAVPIAIQSGFNNLGNVVVQSCINGFGESIMAAYTVGSRLGAFSLLPMETVGGSLSVYAGQNLGAKKYDRIDKGVKASLVINVVVSAVMAVILLIFGKRLTVAFLPEASDVIIGASYRYLLFAAVPGILYGVMFVYQYVLRGVGHTKESMAGSFIQLGGKLVVALLGAYVLHSLDIVWIAWPVSYIAGTVWPYIHYKKYIAAPEAMERN
ncbi:MAG: MATE family efflux transporter [Oscillospiraceae bacterium]|nr:MATE family efflux transporter [Oscillospiraceae bacterium]